MWYNKTCRVKHLTPRYIIVEVSGDNKRAQNTKKLQKEERGTQTPYIDGRE
jgi:hypothetical protein